MASQKILFRDEDPSRECEWSLPKGFLFGGMIHDGSFADYADQFYTAADLLIEQIYKNNIEDFKISNPVLFLYHHAAELYLKALVQHQKQDIKDSDKNIHSLHVLLNRAGNIPDEYKTLILELHEIDPKSTSFRYSNAKPDSLLNEHFCDARRLQTAMNKWRQFANQQLGRMVEYGY